MAMEAYLIKEHNTNVLQSLRKGDLVEIKSSFLYSHWAVYVGKKRVIHLTVEDNSAFVKKEKFWKVVGGCKCYKNNSKDTNLRPDKAKKIVKRGLDMLGHIEYNLWHNCEHFASFCRYGEPKSEQVDFAKKGILTSLVSGILGFAAGAGVVIVRTRK